MQCVKCGVELSAEDLQLADCKFCGAALPHRVKAAEKAAVVEELLADRDGDGVPDVMASMGGAGSGGVKVVTADGGKVVVSREQNVVVKSVTYSTSDGGELPEEARKALEEAGLGGFLAGATPADKPAEKVTVQWADGNRYPATVRQRKEGSALVELSDGRRIWVEDRYIEPA